MTRRIMFLIFWILPRSMISNRFNCWMVAIFGASDRQRNALSGVGYLRFPDYSSDSIGRAGAERALQEHPEVLDQFKTAFPFIEL